MAQVLVHPGDIEGGRFTVRGKEAHHLIRVLRKQARDEVRLFDGEGHLFHGLITHLDSEALTVEGDILSALAFSERRCRVRLFQGIPKSAKFDYVIEKATELGADEIIPFMSKKGQVKLDAAQVVAKSRRWESLAVAASKQSNRPAVTRIAPAVQLKELGTQLSEGLTLTFWEEEKRTSVKDVFHLLGKVEGVINLVIGPESGLAEDEVEWTRSLGARTVTLGERILRTETAGLVALSIVNYELDLF